MALNWDIIDKVVYINLKHRVDRKKNIENQLKLLNVPQSKVVRFNAKQHLLEHIARAQSHLAVLDRAIAENWGNILIIEDNMMFNQNAANRSALAFTFNALQSLTWDVTLLSANYHKVIPFSSTDKLVKPLHASCVCAYIVNQRYQPTLRVNFAETVEFLLQGGAKQQFALDVRWMLLMGRDRWLGMHPVAGHQVLEQSAIEKVGMDHTSDFYRDINTISAKATA